MAVVISEFSGDYRFLSNFYPSPMTWGNQEYPTAEHVYQSCKTGDLEWSERIRLAPTPGDAKRMGQKVPIRANWERIKFNVMAEVTADKYAENPELAQKLVDTGTAFLIEGNTWHDQTWGDCRCPRHNTEVGMNALGIILMRQRLDEVIRHA